MSRRRRSHRPNATMAATSASTPTTHQTVDVDSPVAPTASLVTAAGAVGDPDGVAVVAVGAGAAP